MDDSELLRQYVENHSDEAFAALVTRHVNLVYSVALRHVGNSHHAEEITQAVFIILAKKSAQLRDVKALSSWLLRTTHLTANNFVRGEMRRQRREQEAYMQTFLSESENEIWVKISPLLDTAVAALNEKTVRPLSCGSMKAEISAMSARFWAQPKMRQRSEPNAPWKNCRNFSSSAE